MALPEHDRGDNQDEWTDEDFAKELKRLQRFTSRTEEIVDGLVQWAAARGIRVLGARPAAAEIAGHEQEPRVTDPSWKEQARAGIRRVHIGKPAKGKVPVSIDGAEEFTLPPAAADLLAVFLLGEDRDEEGLAPFRSYHELAAAYSARRGHPAGVRAVVMGISRLRKQLMTAGDVSPQLVETMKNRGARLRIRRGPQ